MRATTRLAVFAALCLAVVLGLALRTSSAQGSAAAQKGMIATVDVVTLLEEMLQTEEYLTPREDLRASIQADLAAGEQQLMALEQEIYGMNPADPARNTRIADFQRLQQELTAKTQAQAAEYDRAGATQAVAIFRRVRDAADAVGDRLGYEYVMASRSADATMGEVNGLTAVTQQILARPILAGAENDDITAQVRAELGLPEPSDEPDATAEPGTGVGSGAEVPANPGG